MGKTQWLIEHHGYIGPQIFLNPDGALGRQHHPRAIEVTLKVDSLIGYPGEGRQAEKLVPAAIGQNRAVPTHEPVKPAQSGDYLISRSQGQMICVGENNLAACRRQILRRQSLHSRLSADGHESRCVHLTVRKRETARTGFALGVLSGDEKLQGRIHRTSIGPSELPAMNCRTRGSSEARTSSGLPANTILPW